MSIYHCPECDYPYEALGALHWHLRREHGYGAGEAYEAAGEAGAVAAEEERRYPGYVNPRNHPDHPSQHVF